MRAAPIFLLAEQGREPYDGVYGMVRSARLLPMTADANVVRVPAAIVRVNRLVAPHWLGIRKLL
jgi:hypothetical protein